MRARESKWFLQTQTFLLHFVPVGAEEHYSNTRPVRTATHTTGTVGALPGTPGAPGPPAGHMMAHEPSSIAETSARSPGNAHVQRALGWKRKVGVVAVPKGTWRLGMVPRGAAGLVAGACVGYLVEGEIQ